MITTAAYVMNQIRSLVDDPLAGWATDEYLLPLLQLAADDFNLEVLQNPELGQLVTTVVLPAVPAYTRSLASYFAAGGMLEMLADVISMKERASGGTRQEVDWVWMDRVRDLPPISPVAFNGCYVWADNDIVLLGADQALDFRIHGKFNPRPITAPDSRLVPNISPILTFKAASLACLSRGNDSLGDRYEVKGDNAASSFVANAIMEMQNLKIRQRSFSGRGSQIR